MTMINLPGTERTFADWKSVSDHLLLEHHPDAPQTKAELNQSSTSEQWECQSCDVPIFRDTALVHAPCLLNGIGDDQVPSLGSKIGVKGICPLCGEGHSTLDRLEEHIGRHEADRLDSLISSEGTCQVCGNPQQSFGDLDDHESCIVTRISDQLDHDSAMSCPITSCTASTGGRNSTLWHLWESHFDTEGLTGTCPGCNETVDVSEIKNHISHLGTLNKPAASKLFQSLPESCSICGFSPFGRRQLWTHYKSDHDIVAADGSCQKCGKSISSNNLNALQSHLLCLFEEGSNETPTGSPEWPCPCCSTSVQSRTKFISHIRSHPELLAPSGADCHLCANPVTDPKDHLSCLAEYGCGLRDTSANSNLNVTLPFQTVRCDQAHSGQDQLTKQAGQEQADRLNQFIEREKESARKEARKQYNENGIRQLGYETDLIYDLVSMGLTSHPDYDTQVVFERPVPDHETDPNGLTDRFNIYPKQEVMVGHEEKGDKIEALVTFTDDQRIGLTPAPHESTSKFKSELTGGGSFHVVSLLHPTPFEREQEAVQMVRDDDRWDIVRGVTSVKEQDTRGADLYAGRLNDSQKRAVNRALGAEQIMCIHGPPGTGKTQTLTALIELAVAEGKRVLACAHSNQATDNLLTGGSTTEHTDPDSLHASVQRNEDISMVRIGGHSRNRLVQEHYLGGSHSRADIVGATTNATATLSRDEFDLVVVDEATQASQPSTFVPWLRGETLVLAGDHHQLPPYASDETAKEQEMHISLFEYMSRRYGESIMERLSTQYRMHQSIAGYSNQMFYDGELRHGSTNATWTIGDIEPLVGYHVDGDERTAESHSKYNPDEARVAADHIEDLCAAGVSPADIGIVTPYGAQIGVLASELGNRNIDYPERIDIDTVDSYQGSEREVIVVSFVRSNPYNSSGFLAFPEEGYRRLNVALTRAKKHLALIGDWETLGTVADHREPAESCAELYAELESYIEKEGQLNQIQTD